MKCMFCGCMSSRVIDSRPNEDGSAIRRRRECEGCGRRFTTYERIDLVPMMVVKKDGRREPFDPDKLRTGVVKACEKRPISMQVVDDLVADIQSRVESDFDREVTSAQLGDMVMDRLQEIDEVAYVRFAAVYRHFKDIQTFMEELSRLLTRKT